MNREELMAKAYAFLSYLFRDARIKERIQRVYLFGSVARNDFDEGSDIDLFVDVEKKNEEAVQNIVGRALNRFLELEGERWNLKGLTPEVKVKVGFLEEWELQPSVEREGLVLYAPSLAGVTGRLRKYLLFSLQPITDPAKRVKVTRTLAGRVEKEYTISGLVQQREGRFLHPRIFLIPSTAGKEIAAFLSKEKVKFTLEEIWQ